LIYLAIIVVVVCRPPLLKLGSTSSLLRREDS